MSGLNDGLELDEEFSCTEQSFLDDADDQKATYQQPLQFDAELNKVDLAANTAKDLDALANHIEQTGGMNQGFALEADALIEGFINPSRPLGYFTQSPTRVMFSASIEAIQEERKTLLQRILQVIHDTFQRIIAWIQRCLKIFSSKKNEKEAEEIEEFFSKNASETKKDLESMQRAVDDPKRAGERLRQIVKKSNNPKFDQYVDELEDRLERMSSRFSNLYDWMNKDMRLNLLVTNKDYYDRLFKVFNHLPKLQQFYRITKHQDFEDFVLMKADLPRMEELAQHFRQEMRQAVSTLGVDTLATVVEKLKFEAQGDPVEITPQKYPIVKLFEILRNVFSEFEKKDFRNQYEGVHDEVFMLDRSIGKWMKDLDAQKLDLQQSNKRRVVVDLMRDLLAQSAAIANILELVMQFYLSRLRPVAWISKSLKQFHQEVKAELRLLDPETAKQVAEYFDLKYDIIKKA